MARQFGMAVTRSVPVAFFVMCMVSPALGAATPIPQNKVITWDSAKDGAGHAYAAGGLTLTFQSKQTKAEATAAELTISMAKGPTIRYPFSGGLEHPETEFAVGRIDAASPALQVLIAPYSGGAHCCLERKLFVVHAGKWKMLEINAGMNGGEMQFPKDVNGDGTPDFVLADDNFAYSFGCYACSWLPPRIFTVRDGNLVDGSNSRKYDDIFRQDIEAAKKACTGADADKGFCAGVAADGARLGEFETNWQWVMKHYPRGEEWFYPDGCKVATRAGQDCPKGSEIKYATFPEALAAFMKKYGYISDAQARWAVNEGKR